MTRSGSTSWSRSAVHRRLITAHESDERMGIGIWDRQRGGSQRLLTALAPGFAACRVYVSDPEGGGPGAAAQRDNEGRPPRRRRAACPA
eukprot:1510159-Prymnesium_polylepis.1